MSTEIRTINEKTFGVIKSATNQLVEMVKPTFGPAGNKVIISKNTYRMVVDDGVQIARDLELSDPAENAVLKVIKDVAITTNDRMGDGTTGAMIMLQAMITEIDRRGKRDGRKIELELKKGAEEAKEQIKEMAKKIETKEELKKVAMVSFDNEPIAEMIADTYMKLGKDGIITIAKSQTLETTMEVADGISIKSGYISPYMITNPERMESDIERPHILITDYRITEINDILPIMEKMAKESKRELVVICDNLEQNAMATAIVNIIQGKFKIIAIAIPAMENRKVFLEDLAILTGGKMFSHEKGDKLEKAEMKDLGRAERFVAKRDQSNIVKPGGSVSEIGMVVSALRMAIENEKDEKIKKSTEERLGTFTQSLAVIKVGAMTENEQKALKYKVEDVVHSVKEAFKNGVVCGGGRTLAKIRTSSPILNAALQYPERQLMENVGKDINDIPVFSENEALNVVTGERGDFMEVGVMDPAGVIIAGIESAVSIVSLLVTCSGILVEAEKEEKK